MSYTNRYADAFSTFIKGIEKEDGVGDDEAEDVFGGLKVAIEYLSWCSSDGPELRQDAYMCLMIGPIEITWFELL